MLRILAVPGLRRIGRGLALALVLGFAAVDLDAQDQGLVIRHLAFKGNRSLDAVTLEAAIATTNSSFFVRYSMVSWLGLGERRRLNERELRVDLARLRLLYQLNGFMDVQIDTSIVRTETDAYITFLITEGEPVRVRSLTISGLDSLPDRPRIVRDLPLQVGMPYDRYVRLEATADTIQSRLWDRGYPSATVLLGRRDLDREARIVDIELVADPGAPAVFGPIRIEGTESVDSSFVRSLLAARPGRTFRYADIYRSQLNLYQSGLFRFATVDVDTTRFTMGDPAVPLTIQVQEGPHFRVRSGLGIATNDCFRANAGWTARNVGGRGRQLDFNGSVSKLGVALDPLASTVCSGLEADTIGSSRVNYALSASIRRPAFLSPSNAITGTVFGERRSEYRIYLRDEIGTSVTFTRESQRGVPFSLTYRLAYGSTQATAVSFCAFFLACRQDDIAQLRERRLAASLIGTVSRQRVNNPLDPTRGSFYSLEATVSSPLIGSSRFSEFTRLVGEASWYTPLGREVVLAAHVKAGAAVSPRLRLGAGEGSFIPPDQRFYAGGANDVRGYDRNELGPVVYVTSAGNLNEDGSVIDADSVQVAPIGGNTLAVGNLELRLPSPLLGGRLRWALFVDAGSVWERGGSLASGAAFRVTPGIGIRFGTPLGPMRADIAYTNAPYAAGGLYSLLDEELTLVRSDYRKPRTGKFNLQVSVGQAF